MFLKRLLVVAFLPTLFCLSAQAAQKQKELTTGWMAYEKGFQARPGEGRSGSWAVACENGDANAAFGAQNVVSLNQVTPTPFLVSAWSRSEDVSGTPDDGYSLYIDLAYADGSHLWGTISPFDCGTHDWQERHIKIVPTKPVKDASIFVLLRRHTGRAWFSNISISDDHGAGGFDFQSQEPPALLSGEHWFARDVKSNSKVVPASLWTSVGLKVKKESVDGDLHGIVVSDTSGVDRELTLYYCEKFDAVSGKWWNSIRTSVPIEKAECGTFVSASSGANGLSSRYPFGAVTGQKIGRMLAVPPSMGPRLVRLFYNPSSRLLCAAFDVALIRQNRAHPGEADAEVLSLPIDPAWGLRDAASRYYKALPEAFRDRMPKQGIWMPFTDPATISHPEDFGIAVHEGDNSVQSDDHLGILSFRYTEPMTWWMSMAPSVPRTYESAVELLNKNLQSSDIRIKKQAQAVISSGAYGSDGRINVSFHNEPWANGAVWVLNPNPALPRSEAKALQADIVFDPAEAKKRYGSTLLSGEYLDSLEAHAEVLDYRKESLASSGFVPSYDDLRRPVIPQAYSTFEIAHAMSTQLHDMGKLLMSNTTPLRLPYYMPLLDCAGTEVNWMDGGTWTPDSDEEFCYRRTMCYHKPYMLLQNTDFSKFGPHEVSLYFKKCLFYGVYPSFFSADAATHPYWENRTLYDRDRPLFKTTIPLIRTISTAGWEPVTNARTNDPAVLIERYGDSTWTLFNESSTTKAFSITFDGLSSHATAKDLATGEFLKLDRSGLKVTLEMFLAPGDCRIVQLIKH